MERVKRKVRRDVKIRRMQGWALNKLETAHKNRGRVRGGDRVHMTNWGTRGA